MFQVGTEIKFYPMTLFLVSTTLFLVGTEIKFYPVTLFQVSTTLFQAGITLPGPGETSFAYRRSRQPLIAFIPFASFKPTGASCLAQPIPHKIKVGDLMIERERVQRSSFDRRDRQTAHLTKMSNSLTLRHRHFSP